MSSNQKTKSSAVKGAPSDQRMPLRSEMVVDLPSGLSSKDLATEGTILLPV